MKHRSGIDGLRPIAVVHIITGLGTGGAEMMLYKLVRHGQPYWKKSLVVSLTSGGELAQRIRDTGVEVVELGLHSGSLNPFKLWRLIQLLRSSKPDVVQTWMYHADFIGGIAALLAGRVPVVWGIRHSTFDPSKSNPRTIRIAKLCARLSRFLPWRILCCSDASREAHLAMGYSSEKMIVVPNGFDVELFKPITSAGRRLRAELDLPEKCMLIGYVARFDPQKDHESFVKAAAILHRNHPDVHFLLMGSGMERGNEILCGWIEREEMSDRIHLLGNRTDLREIVPGLDISTMAAAYGEGFPNVVGEAMACGVPCVVTDVGDSAAIIGPTGVVVPPKNPEALVQGWQQLIDLGEEARKDLGFQARKRVMANYSIESVSRRYAELYATHAR